MPRFKSGWHLHFAGSLGVRFFFAFPAPALCHARLGVLRLVNVRFIMQYVRRHSFRYLLGLLALLAVDIFNTYMPTFLGNIIDGLTDHSIADLSGVLHWVWWMLGAGAVIAIGRFGWRYFLFGSARSVEL